MNKPTVRLRRGCSLHPQDTGCLQVFHGWQDAQGSVLEGGRRGNVSSTENITLAEVTPICLCTQCLPLAPLGDRKSSPADRALHAAALEQEILLVQQKPAGNNGYKCQPLARHQVLGRHCCRPGSRGDHHCLLHGGKPLASSYLRFPVWPLPGSYY